MDVVAMQLKLYTYDEKYFTARSLKRLKKWTNINSGILAFVIVFMLSVFLNKGERSRLLANSILTIVPLLITYVFRNEQPNKDYLLVYWGCYSLLSLLDTQFERYFIGCYLFKILILSTLFLKPFNGAERILNCLEMVHLAFYRVRSEDKTFYDCLNDVFDSDATLRPTYKRKYVQPMNSKNDLIPTKTSTARPIFDENMNTGSLILEDEKTAIQFTPSEAMPYRQK